MTVTARKHALTHRITPGFGQLVSLYILEIAVILSWTLLLDTVFNFISGSWLILLPLSYFLSVTLLAWLERTRSGARGQCPLEATGLAEITLDGFRPSEWQTLRRLLMTPPLILLLFIGLFNVPGTGKTILNMISGTRIVPLNADMDPRLSREIFNCRRKALMKVISYTLVSLMVSAVIILVPTQFTSEETNEQITSIHSLPDEERELLASYLQMKAMYPDSLEYRVRLASLYYRNGMEEDLQLELEEIRRIDPDHAILLLQEDLSVTMEDLIVNQDSTFDDSLLADTSHEEPLPPPVDSVSLDLRLVATDSISEPVDSLPPQTDSIPAPVDSIDVSATSASDSIAEVDTLAISIEQDSLIESDSTSLVLPDEVPVEQPGDSIEIIDTSSAVTEDSLDTPSPIPDSSPPTESEGI
jgi:hypothetical protein